nr:hypothetical protein [Ralstonia solanacearum]
MEFKLEAVRMVKGGLACLPAAAGGMMTASAMGYEVRGQAQCEKILLSGLIFIKAGRWKGMEWIVVGQ